ncbi:carboxylesterase/lipase family protein [Agreia sp. VKM Ac-1783]|uniref:carboxylesterase/lipase family protein n=1 Tax=Agreia sp. VKM Ac-1783 TaxID=1938889 RepID=UPI000A2ADCEE|nr:carboxylesterase/lipase family protein [Agreia sp. VKM Ac-1783]SMQ61732.1 para-nitrobenzyl esterase [Agreia sp. VKM Ac-1783]
MRLVLASGVVQGSTSLTKRADVQCYLGIPFAASPVGELRFRPPQPVAPWDGELEAKKFGPAAPQNPDPFMTANDYFQPLSSEEDCLNLNVWTPRADARARPVMVWIHGGGYIGGSNSSGLNNGAELAATFDVVVVSINYRLGALGYLQLGHLLGEEYADAGNLGVLDQIAALEWVRDNIAAFGGDPQCVTVFGESAGGAAVATLLGTPRAEGLFHRAIVQSGTAERARSLPESEAITAAFLDAAGMTEQTASRLLDMPLEEVLVAQQRFADSFARGVVGLALPFQPTIDGRVLTELPLDAVARGVNGGVPLLVGTNRNETSFFTEPMSGDGDSAEATESKLAAVFAEELSAETGDRADYEAVLTDELGREPRDRQVLESLLTDRLYRQPTNRLLAARASSTAETYAYLFTWETPLFDGRLGACHVLDVPFVFRQLHRIEAVSLVGEHPPQQLSDWMSAIWVRFADTGVPTSAALPEWAPYEPDARSTMELNTRPRLLSDPLAGLRRFWLEMAEVSAS